MRRTLLIAAMSIVGMVAAIAPAGAVTIGPDGLDDGGSWFEASDTLFGPISDDDPWSATLTIAGRSGCDIFGSDKGCWLDPGLTVGHTYDAVLSESGGGFWYCSIYSQDVCHWDDEYAYKYEYRFTYTGSVQKLTPYYAPTALTIKKKKASHPHRWIVTCGVTRAGRVFAGAGIHVQWRDRKHPRWHTFGHTWKANRYGKASGWVQWSGISGTVRCMTSGDWHTRAGASRGVRVWTR